jgi:hypothetical protein
MQVIWSSHLPKEEQEEFKKYLLNSDALLNRLSDIIKQKIKAAEDARLSKDGYESPGWSERQADTIGYLRFGKEIQDLINLKG